MKIVPFFFLDWQVEPYVGTARKRPKTVLQEASCKCPCGRTNGEISRGRQVGAWDQEQRWLRCHGIEFWPLPLTEHFSNVLFLFMKNCISYEGVLECMCSCGECVCVCVHVCMCVSKEGPVNWAFGRSMQPWFVFKAMSSLIKYQVPNSLISTLASVTQSCPTLCDPMDCSLPGYSVHEVLQARILEWVTIPFSGVLPNPRIKPKFPALQAV